jgi:hypothetical protein
MDATRPTGADGDVAELILDAPLLNCSACDLMWAGEGVQSGLVEKCD